MNEIIAYHGSYEHFLKFSENKIKANKELHLGWGFYFVDNPQTALKYGNYIYKVKLFNNKNHYHLIDFNKPIEPNILYNILTSLYYKINRKKINYDNFKLLYNIEKEIENFKNKIWNELVKIDSDLNMLTFSEVFDTDNKNSWFYISNYINNNQINKLCNKYYSLLNIKNNKKILDFNLHDIGFLIYKKISHLLNGDKNASLFLLKNGIDGCMDILSGYKYYSIFNSNDIKIVEIKKYKQNYMKNIINEIVVDFFQHKNLLIENLQLANKVYFNTGKLTEEDKNIILNITNGDNYTKIISDFYYEMKKTKQLDKLDFNSIIDLKFLYKDVKTYNKNVFPIVGFDVFNINPNDIDVIMRSLYKRRLIIQKIKDLPSIAIRNLKNDIRKERIISQLDTYLHNLDYFFAHYSLLSNRDKKMQEKILNKMFKNNITLSELLSFVEDKQNLIGGVEFTKEDIIELSKTEDFEIIYNHDNKMIVRVDSPEGIKKIGCNSLWCFTYGGGFDRAYRDWYAFSHNVVGNAKKTDTQRFDNNIKDI